MLLDRAPRLVLVARSFHDRTDSALRYLQENGVPVQLITVVFYEDAGGNRIVDVNNGRDAADVTVVPATAPATGRPSPAGRTRATIAGSVADLLDAGIIDAGEVIEWKRPQLGQAFRATVDANGQIRTEDGQVFNSLSTAADTLTGGSHNGWEVWTVPRLGAVKIGALRSSLVRPA